MGAIGYYVPLQRVYCRIFYPTHHGVASTGSAYFVTEVKAHHLFLLTSQSGVTTASTSLIQSLVKTCPSLHHSSFLPLKHDIHSVMSLLVGQNSAQVMNISFVRSCTGILVTCTQDYFQQFRLSY